MHVEITHNEILSWILILQADDRDTLHRTIECIFINQSGSTEYVEKMAYTDYRVRLIYKWEDMQTNAGGSAKRWPAYICSLFSHQELSYVQCGELAAFIVINSINTSQIKEWFGLIGTKHSDRMLVFMMVSQLTYIPEQYTYVFGFCVRQLQYQYIYTRHIVTFKHNSTGNTINLYI